MLHELLTDKPARPGRQWQVTTLSRLHLQDLYSHHRALLQKADQLENPSIAVQNLICSHLLQSQRETVELLEARSQGVAQ